jgi:hypothetical protein
LGLAGGALGTLVCDSSKQDLNAGRGVLSMLTEVTVYSDGASPIIILLGDLFSVNVEGFKIMSLIRMTMLWFSYAPGGR